MNLDSRPLPPGWSQHYDAQRPTWSNIQNDVPPQVSITHPLGPNQHYGHVQAPTLSHRIERQGISSTTTNSDVSSFHPGYKSHAGVGLSLPSKASQPGLSLAQKLYASASTTPPTVPPPVPPITPPNYDDSPSHDASRTASTYQPPPAEERPHHRAATFPGSYAEPSHSPPPPNSYYSHMPSAPSTYARQQPTSHRHNTSYTPSTPSYLSPPTTYSSPPARNIVTTASPTSPPPHVYYPSPPTSYPTTPTSPSFSVTPTAYSATPAPAPAPPSQVSNRLSSHGQHQVGRPSHPGQGIRINPLLGAAGRVVGTAVLNGVLPGAGTVVNTLIDNNPNFVNGVIDTGGQLINKVFKNEGTANGITNGIANLTNGGSTNSSGGIDYQAIFNADLQSLNSPQQTNSTASQTGSGQSLYQAYQQPQQQYQATGQYMSPLGQQQQYNSPSYPSQNQFPDMNLATYATAASSAQENALALANAQLQAMQAQLEAMNNIGASATQPDYDYGYQNMTQEEADAQLAAATLVAQSVAEGQECISSAIW